MCWHVRFLKYISSPPVEFDEEHVPQYNFHEEGFALVTTEARIL
jgi:hypothetical protein